jgi:hypothetical protein
MKQVKVDKMILKGNINGDFQEGEQVMFDVPLTIPSGRIYSDEDGVIIVYDTLKKNIHREDITPRVNFLTNDEIKEDPSYMVDWFEKKHREPNDEEYNVLNEFLREEYNDDDKYTNLDRDCLTVYDIHKDFKILNHSSCTIYRWSNGKESVSWDTYRYAYRHGLLYPYDSNEDSDDCEIDISGLFKKK